MQTSHSPCSSPWRLVLWLTFFLLLSVGFHQRVQAREPGATEIAAARQEFVAGVEAARAGDWQVALQGFERSYALYPHPQTLFNIAGARRRLGRLVGAAEAYRKYLRAAPAESDEGSRRSAEQALSEIEPELARLAIRAEGLLDQDELTLDANGLSHDALGLSLPVDPGRHVVTVRRAGVELARKEIELTAREQGQVLLSLPGTVATPAQAARAAPVVATPQTQPRRNGDRPLVRQWWLWTAVGVVIGGAVAGVIIARDRPADSLDGNVMPGEVSIP